MHSIKAQPATFFFQAFLNRESCLQEVKCLFSSLPPTAIVWFHLAEIYPVGLQSGVIVL